MLESKVMNRWLVVVGAILILLCLGANPNIGVGEQNSIDWAGRYGNIVTG